MGFSAYGVTQGDDPVAQAMKGLIDNASGHEHQIALLWQAIEKLSAGRANCRRRLRAAGCLHDQRDFDAERLNRWSSSGLRPEAPAVRSWAGRPCTPRVVGLEVGPADQVDAVGHGGEDAGTGGVACGRPSASRQSTWAGRAG
jgi:hypothetical protein